LLLELRVAYATLLSASSCHNQLINGFELVKIWARRERENMRN
jgi:hypothetical protein